MNDNAPNVDELVSKGIAAIKEKDMDEARTLLQRAVELNPYHESAWLWLSGVVESTEDQRTCLENVLAINPDNERARKGLDYIITQSLNAPKKTTGPLTAPKSAPPAEPAPTPSSSSAFSDMVTSVDWGNAPSDNVANNEPASDEFDQWMKDLNIRSGSSTSTFESTESTVTSPFTDVNFGNDPFTSGPFTTESAPFSTTEEDSFGSSFGEDTTDAFRSSPSTSPFSAPLTYTPPPPEPVEPPPAPTKQEPIYSPMPKDFGAFQEDDDDIRRSFYDDEYDDTAGDDPFLQIPPDIRATRLPGSNERPPILLVLLTLVLLVANVGVGTMLALKFMG